MARFLVGTIPVLGHVNPVLPIVSQLVARKHEVWWYTGRGFKEKIEATGARHVPITKGIDLSCPKSINPEWSAQRTKLKGISQLKFDLKHGFIDGAVIQLQELTKIVQEFPADVLLCDVFFLGMSWLHEKTGIPWAAIGVSVLSLSSSDTAPFGLGMPPDSSFVGKIKNRSLNWLTDKILLRDITVYLDHTRETLGLRPLKQNFFTAGLSPFLYLQGTTPSFEYPRSDLPPQVHFIGAINSTPSSNFRPPTWWQDLEGDAKDKLRVPPVIFVTQGTIANNPRELIKPAIQGLAQEDVLIIVTTGRQSSIDDLGLESLPTNVRVESFIPYERLFPLVDVMVTNGGLNGVNLALTHGVPLVTAGTTEDKPEVCARVQWSGTGINLKTNTPTPIQLREAVKTILGSPIYQQKAQQMKAEISCYDAPVIAVNLLETLAITKQPV